jgi:hypothetical protein
LRVGILDFGLGLVDVLGFVVMRGIVLRVFCIFGLCLLTSCELLSLAGVVETLSAPEVREGLTNAATNAVSGNWVGALWALGGVGSYIVTAKVVKSKKASKSKPKKAKK